MKRIPKLSTGVTLLEIMLVLAIASMVIVMSIRYYQNATNSQNANIIMEEIQNVTAAADNLAQGGTGYTNVSSTSVGTVAGSNNMVTPYGSSISFTGNNTAGYSVSIGSLPNAVCTAIGTKLKANSKFVPSTAACSSGTLSYSYNASS